jgi:hypothetical protein
MRPSDKLFAALARFDQHDLPVLVREIDNGHPTANTKDRLRDLHKMLSVLVRYVVVENSEKHGEVLRASPAQDHSQAPAQAVAQHFPATSNPSLGAPPMRVATVVVSDNLDLGPVALGIPTTSAPSPVVAAELDPEPDNTIQIVTKRDGSRVVIPPRGSRAPKRVFAPGLGADATYIAEYDAPQEGPSAPASVPG